MGIKKAYIACWCFWWAEELFREQDWVLDTEVWYTWWINDNPTYGNHPWHAEAVEITYDTKYTSFKKLLDFFFRMHNPATINQQWNDIWSSYRSAIFYQNDEEFNIAKEMVEIVDKSWKCEYPVVTTLEKYNKFWPAEDYHQDYLQKNPNWYTCHNIYFSESFI